MGLVDFNTQYFIVFGLCPGDNANIVNDSFDVLTNFFYMQFIQHC